MHLAGNWNKWSNDRTCLQSLRSTPAAKALAVKYHTQILIMSKRLENRLISHYPGDMAKPEEDVPIRVRPLQGHWPPPCLLSGMNAANRISIFF